MIESQSLKVFKTPVDGELRDKDSGGINSVTLMVELNDLADLLQAT